MDRLKYQNLEDKKRLLPELYSIINFWEQFVVHCKDWSQNQEAYNSDWSLRQPSCAKWGYMHLDILLFQKVVRKHRSIIII